MRLALMRFLVGRCAASAAVALVGVALAEPASAQQIQPGLTNTIFAAPVRGVDTATDSSGNHLVVGGQGNLYAVCTNSQGAPITGPMHINATAGYASFPRATFSPYLFGGAGGFMLAWAEAANDPSGSIARTLVTRPVSCTGAVGVPQGVAGGIWWEPGNVAIAHSLSSGTYLVAWQTQAHTVAASLLDGNGAPWGPVVALSSGMGRDPSVSWNPYTNVFGVSFSGETYSAFVTVPAWNATAFARNTFNVGGGKMTTMTDVAFNAYTGAYVMSWLELVAGQALSKIAEFDASGNMLTLGVATNRLAAYDGFSLALNPISGTFLLSGTTATDIVMGVELNGRGYPFNGENSLSGAKPAYYTRVSASPVSKTWDVAFSNGFGSLATTIVSSFASGGGPAGTHPAPGASAPPPSSPTPTPAPGGCPGTAPVAGWVCVNGGWLPPDHPLAGGAPAPAPAPTPAPAPAPSPSTCPGSAPVAGWVCVNGGWLPPDHPLAAGVQSPAPAPAPAPTGCATVQPGAGWTCVNGNWLPPGAAPSCPTIQPGAGWTCVNGNWLPPGANAAPAPAPTSCTTPQPGAGWYCVNGGWVPPNSPLAPGNACVGSAPAPGWVCTATGGWVPPDHPLANGGGDD